MRIARNVAVFVFIIAVILVALRKDEPTYQVTGSGTSSDPFTIIQSSEEACKELVSRSRIRIDSFIMLRCATTDTAVWRRYEDSIVKEIEYVKREVGAENMNKPEYLNTHPQKKIPCMIGDSVMIFYKLTPKG
jgi:hypothetical protein